MCGIAITKNCIGGDLKMTKWHICVICKEIMDYAIPQICDLCLERDDGTEKDPNSYTDYDDWGYDPYES